LFSLIFVNHKGAEDTEIAQRRSSIRTVVTQGCDWVQSEGGPKVEIRAGDVVWCPPREKHWHGGTSTTAMSHIAIQESLDGKKSNGWRRSATKFTKLESYGAFL
jgi:quercetin dioxygenase-like cupin family protein